MNVISKPHTAQAIQRTRDNLEEIKAREPSPSQPAACSCNTCKHDQSPCAAPLASGGCANWTPARDTNLASILSPLLPPLASVTFTNSPMSMGAGGEPYIIVTVSDSRYHTQRAATMTEIGAYPGDLLVDKIKECLAELEGLKD